MQVLVVEDNPLLQELTTGLLSQVPLVSVGVAANGQDAVDCFFAGSFDLVLMDLEMPVLDGYEAAKRIRDIESARGVSERIPIIAYTSAKPSSIAARVTHCGMDAILSKPAQLEAMSQCLSRWSSPDCG